MKKIFLTSVVLLASLWVFTQQTAKQLRAANGQSIGFLEFKPRDYGSQRHPLIIYLHGIGERGPAGSFNTDATTVQSLQVNEIPKLCAAGASLTFTVNCERFSFVVLSPQLAGGYSSWQTWYVDEMLKYARANLQIDTTRIYLTGLSLGGGGVWRYASTSVANASQFAALAPVCGTCDWANLCNIAQAQTPVWAFHAQDDGVVPVSCTNSAVAGLAACTPPLLALTTIYTNGNHYIWGRAYDTTNAWATPNLYQWLLTQKRTIVVPPTPPTTGVVASAGADQTVSGTTAVLDGTGSSGYPGGWAVTWEVKGESTGKPERPAGSTWDVFPGYDKTGPKKELKNLSPGRWVFVLTVQDGKGAKATDEVVLTVR